MACAVTAPLELTLGCGQYDRTIPLQDGTVVPDGISLRITTLRPGELFRRQARDAEFDVSEFSLSTFSLLLARGDTRFVAIPIFLSRMFRHSSVYVRAGGPVRVAEDLAGRRIGVQEFQQTAGVWIRGILQDDHGVDPRGVEWVFGPYDEPGAFVPRVALELPADIRYVPLEEGRSLDGALREGAIDAIIGAHPPRSFVEGRPDVVRLFRDHREAELDYYRRSGIFPIMHVVVIRRAIWERDPWVAASLARAFEDALRVGRERASYDGTLFCAFPWFHYHRLRDAAVLGEDPFTYGLDGNRRVLETFARYMQEQGLVGRRIGVDELFPAV